MKTKCHVLSLIIMIFFLSYPCIVNAQHIKKLTDPAVPTGTYANRLSANKQFDEPIDPVIMAMVEEVNPDTLYKTLLELQNWGSRFMLKENHKDLATWLMKKFVSYGFADVKLDSVRCVPYQFTLADTIWQYDTTWQYNVVCTLHGNSAPEEVYVIGAHYDSQSSDDPYNEAPGADDNGSGTAATLEIARVMAKMNYHPEATIQFILFAAEELGLLGSQHAAHSSRINEQDIRLDYTMDMISYNPQNLDEMVVVDYPGFEWASSASALAIEKYTSLSVIINKNFGPGVILGKATDSYSYWFEGYPALGFWETEISPFIHTQADTVGNYNIPYLAKVTGGVLAAVAEQEQLPIPQSLTAHANNKEITLQWKPTNNELIQGINIYRSDTTGDKYQKISTETGSASLFHDLTAEPNKQYYYVLSTVNNSLYESKLSNEVTGARYNFSDTLLVLANLKNSQSTPEEVIAFYQDVLDTIPYAWNDINATHKISHGLLSRYRSILWMSNTASFEILDEGSIQCVSEFIANGGNILFTGFNPSRFWTNNHTYPGKISDSALMHKVFKVDSADLKGPCLLFRANAVAPDYQNLEVDTLKHTQPQYPGQINNIEVFTPSSEAHVIYRFDSKQDSSSYLGIMKNRPVGLEYMGTDFKSILLSFPLYYLDKIDAKEFLHYVMSEKFNHQVGIESRQLSEPFCMDVYPNPASSVVNVTFSLPKTVHVKLIFVSIHGQVSATWFEGNLEQGPQRLSYSTDQYSSGLYQVVLLTDEGIISRKIVKL